MRHQFAYFRLVFNRSIVSVGLFVMFWVSFPQIAITEKLYPVDEAQKDPSFYAFRNRLIEAIDHRDVSYIISILSDDVRGSFGSGPGVESFKIDWRIESPDTLFWETLKGVLAAGGGFQTVRGKKVFLAPYVSSSFPPGFDSYEYAAIVGKNVRLRERPSIESRVIKLLSYDIVKVSDWRPQKSVTGDRLEWLAVVLDGKWKGYVSESYVRGPNEYRAYFEKRKGRWAMTFFGGGD